MAKSGAGFWAHAFKVEDAEPLSKEDKDWLKAVAGRIAKRRLITPAVLFLEGSKPLHFIAGQTVRFLDPIFSMVVPISQFERLARILENRRGAEFLLRELEAYERD